jgi:hypothetical protein
VTVFAYDGVWLRLPFGSSTLLLLVGLAGIVVGQPTLVPDMLSYVSSMTYNNIYFPLPERGGMLNAMHRAQILHDQLVLVGDVEGAEVGRLAFMTSDTARRLKKGRKYY